MFRAGTPISRLAAVLLVFLAIALLWAVAVAPVVDARQDHRDRIERAERLLTGFRARRPDIDGLKKALADQQRNSTARGSFVQGANPTLAGARLQGRIKALTRAAGNARLVSTQIVRSETATGGSSGDTFPRVTVRAQMIASVDAVRQIFHALEAGQPYVFVDNVSISVRRAARGSRKTPVRGESGLLSVRYDAYGYLWTAGDGARPAPKPGGRS